jgi:hypothetical protein
LIPWNENKDQGFARCCGCCLLLKVDLYNRFSPSSLTIHRAGLEKDLNLISRYDISAHILSPTNQPSQLIISRQKDPID